MANKRCECDCGTCCCEEPIEFQGMKPTRDNVRLLVRGFKVQKGNLLDDLDALEQVYGGYAESKGKPTLQKQFAAVRDSLETLAAALRAERL